MAFGLSQKTISQLKAVFKNHPEITQVKIYGSRAKGHYKRGSDIDLAFFSESKKDLSSNLSWELDDLPIPYSFDLVNYSKLNDSSLKEEIDKNGKLFYKKSKKASFPLKKQKKLSQGSLSQNQESFQKEKLSYPSIPKNQEPPKDKQQSLNFISLSKTDNFIESKKTKDTIKRHSKPNKNLSISKQTEIGQIPEDWELHSISEVGKVITGTTPKTSNEAYYGNKYKLISPADLDSGQYVNTAHRMLTEEGLAQCKVLPKYSILVGCIGNIGKIGMTLDEKSATNQQINAIICNKKSNPHFIFYCLTSVKKKLQLKASQTTVPILNKTNFEKFKIPLPPLLEQEKIAGVLSQIRQAIETQKKLIAVTRELKQSTMKQLFTYGVRGKKTKQTEIGQIPEDWELHSISEVGEVITGTTPKTSNEAYYGNKYKLISPADLDSGQYVNTAHRMLTEEGLAQCKVLPKYSVLVGCIGNIGKIGMTLDEKSATNQQINAIICNKKSNSHFIFYCLSSFKKKLQLKASQTTVPILNKTNFEQFKISLPRLITEQKKITDILTKIDQKIETHKKKKSSLEELFKTALHQLMTGKIRVHKLNINLEGNNYEANY